MTHRPPTVCSYRLLSISVIFVSVLLPRVVLASPPDTPGGTTRYAEHYFGDCLELLESTVQVLEQTPPAEHLPPLHDDHYPFPEEFWDNPVCEAWSGHPSVACYENHDDYLKALQELRRRAGLCGQPLVPFLCIVEFNFSDPDHPTVQFCIEPQSQTP